MICTIRPNFNVLNGYKLKDITQQELKVIVLFYYILENQFFHVSLLN